MCVCVSEREIRREGEREKERERESERANVCERERRARQPGAVARTNSES